MEACDTEDGVGEVTVWGGTAGWATGGWPATACAAVVPGGNVADGVAAAGI